MIMVSEFRRFGYPCSKQEKVRWEGLAMSHIISVYNATSLIPRLSPYANEKSKGKGYRFSVLQATEGWVGPGNEATKLSKNIKVFAIGILMNG